MTREDLEMSTSKPEAINHPSHYAQGDVECIEAIKASMTHEAFCGYLKGNILKYIWRYKRKNGIEDICKAEWYINRLCAEEKEN